MENREYLNWIDNELYILGMEESYNENIVKISNVSVTIQNIFHNLLASCEVAGVEFGQVRSILTNLIFGYPLTQIKEEEIDAIVQDDPTVCVYRCSRWLSLRKLIKKRNDGGANIYYHDAARSICVDINNPSKQYTGGIGESILYEMDPIKFPYEIPKEPIRIFMETFKYHSSDYQNDTFAVMYFRYPDGKMTEVKRFFKKTKDGMEEISKQEYIIRRKKWEESNGQSE